MIGRKKEVEKLNDLYNSGRAELVAVYGRRRIGKTFLVSQTFSNKITFLHAGLSPLEELGNTKKEQLRNFYYSMRRQGVKANTIPRDWLEAFFVLECYLQDIDDGERQLIFLDELPWMDTKRSGFMTAFESFWNNWGCHRQNLMVIVCGSASSWMQDKLINNHGGLYGRVTCEIKLSPFTLRECEEFFVDRGFDFSRYDVIQSYMVTGGIPYYLSYFMRDKSVAQNVDLLMFRKQAVLRHEYDRLFTSVFSSPEDHKAIVEFLQHRNAGYTRNEISNGTGIANGGDLTLKLNALIASGFIIDYVPFGMPRNKIHYKLVDPFCLFYLHFVKDAGVVGEDYWLRQQSSQSVVSWQGYAFENVCFNHIPQIKRALGIQAIASKESVWSKRSDDTEGTQIDLLIERADRVINACEIKHYGNDFEVSKAYYKTLLNRKEILRKETSGKMSIFNTLITTFGLARNQYSSIFVNVVTMDDLFRD